MKFISIQENINKALNIVNQSNFKNINLPILNNVLIRAKQNEIEFISTNLETAITHKIRSKVDQFGEFTVDLKTLASYINLLKEETVKLEKVQNDLLIEAGSYKTKIIGTDSKDYPLIPNLKKEKEVVLNCAEFKDALLSVIFSVSYDSRPELSGVLITFEKNKIILTATDGFRLAEKIIDSEIVNEEKKIIIPHKTIQELLRIVSHYKNTEKLIIQSTEDQILFKIDSTELISRTINSSYPDYKEIIPKEHETKIELKKEELIRAVKAVALFSKNKNKEINIELKNGKMLIKAFSDDTGEAEVRLETKQSGQDQEVNINYRYLLEGLNIIKEEKIEILLVDKNTPCILKGLDQQNFLYLIMTIRD
jgi:DNA polymerase III subunit beta